MALKGTKEGGGFIIEVDVHFEGEKEPTEFIADETPDDFEKCLDAGDKIGKLLFLTIDGTKARINLNKVKYIEYSTIAGGEEKEEEPNIKVKLSPIELKDGTKILAIKEEKECSDAEIKSRTSKLKEEVKEMKETLEKKIEAEEKTEPKLAEEAEKVLKSKGRPAPNSLKELKGEPAPKASNSEVVDETDACSDKKVKQSQ